MVATVHDTFQSVLINLYKRYCCPVMRLLCTIFSFSIILSCSSERQIFHHTRVFEFERWAGDDSIVVHFVPEQHYDSVMVKIGLQYFTDFEFDVLYMSLKINDDGGMERIVTFDINFDHEKKQYENSISKLNTLRFVAVRRLQLVKNVQYTFTLMHHMPFPFIDRIRAVELSLHTY